MIIKDMTALYSACYSERSLYWKERSLINENYAVTMCLNQYLELVSGFNTFYHKAENLSRAWMDSRKEPQNHVGSNTVSQPLEILDNKTRILCRQQEPCMEATCK